MTPQDRALADALIAARQGGPLVSASATPDPDDWMAVQTALLAETGPAGAFKAGAAPAPLTFAPIAARQIWRDGVMLPAAESRLRGVELELGFTLTDDPPAAGDPNFEAALRACLVMTPAIEIVECRLDDHMNPPPLLKLADNVANGGLVRGGPLADWSAIDLKGPKVRLQIGDAIVWDGPSTVPGGDAFQTVLRFAQGVGDHCGGLQAGQTIITGALTGLHFAKAGDTVSGTIEGLGTITANFE